MQNYAFAEYDYLFQNKIPIGLISVDQIMPTDSFFYFQCHPLKMYSQPEIVASP